MKKKNKINKTRVQIFIEVFEHWRKIFNMPEIAIRGDYRIDCSAMYDDANPKKPVIRYHPNRIAQDSTSEVIEDALHELGHYLFKGPYITKIEQIQEEHYAERFALTIMKAAYLEDYLHLVNVVKKRAKRWQLNDVHHAAYILLFEYRDILRQKVKNKAC